MRTDRADPTAPFEVGIVGGGPAGAVVAQMLATAGVRVVVLEATPGPRVKVGESLPASAGPLLERLGLQEILTDPCHLVSQGRRSSWGSENPRERHALSEPGGSGWHLERSRFEGALARSAIDHGADWLWGWRLRHGERQGRGWRLACATHQGESEVEVGWVVDASGRTSSWARRHGATRRLRYDRLVGIAAVLSGAATETDDFLEVEAVADGWWYSARLADGRLVVVRFGDGDLLAGDLLRGSPEAWFRSLSETQTTLRRIEGSRYEMPGHLEVLPAESSRLEEIAGEGWLAVGDAATAYDPLSSYGMASAMGSGYYAARALLDLLDGRRDALDAYRLVMQRTYGTYLDLLRTEYARELRFADQTFWSRRHRDEFGALPLPSVRAGGTAQTPHSGVVV